MKMPSWSVLFGVAALAVVGVVASIMFRLGSFKDVTIEHKMKNGPFTVVAREHLGAYHKIAAMIVEMETWARSHGEPCNITFGEYFDNPEQTDEDRLRSRGGCVVTNPQNTEALKKVLAPNMTLETIEIPDALVAEFEGSPAIGPLKVYPKAFAYMQEHDLVSAGPVLELYEVLNSTAGRTQYFFPVRSARP